MSVPETIATTRYKIPNPKKYNEIEYGISIREFMKIYFAVTLSP